MAAVVANIGQARDLVFGMLKTAWDANAGGLPIIYDGMSARLDAAEDGFSEAAIVHAAAGQAALGGKQVGLLYRSNARLQVDIKTPMNQGRPDALVQAIREAFIGARATPDVVTFVGVQVVEMPRSGARIVTRVVVYFNYDEIF